MQKNYSVYTMKLSKNTISKNEKYDIILFENFRRAFNHKYDVVLIARLLQRGGLRIAILDIYGEDNYDEIQEIPVIHMPYLGYPPDDKLKGKHPQFFFILKFLFHQHFYMKRVVQYVSPLARAFYVGSYHPQMTSAFMKLSKPCFYWGLRSFFFNGDTTFGKILHFRVKLLKKRFYKNSFQRLFVSNEIIKKEFMNLNIPENRLIIRPERCIEDKPNPRFSKLNDVCTFLIIGKLREEKRILLSIKAFRQLKNENLRLWLVGKSFDQKYEDLIEKAMHGDYRIMRVNQYLDYELFNNYMKQSHFVLFADKQEPSSITNGTMYEALINHRPIIAPNYNPYSYYVTKYNIGLLYDPDSVESYIQVLQKAASMGCMSFFVKISNYLATVKFDTVSKQLSEAIIKQLNINKA